MRNNDLLAGLLLSASGVTVLWQTTGMPVGTPGAMGPGFWPLVVASLLTVGGVGLVLSGIGRSRSGDFDPGPWRRPAAMIAGILLFATLLRPFGLVAAAPAAVVVSSLAHPRTRFGPVMVLAGALTIFSILLFSLALKLPVPVLGAGR